LVIGAVARVLDDKDLAARRRTAGQQQDRTAQQHHSKAQLRRLQPRLGFVRTLSTPMQSSIYCIAELLLLVPSLVEVMY
jgi:chromosome condensin MukBEF MukE localization factor